MTPELTVWPHCELPPPRAVRGMRSSRAASSASATSSIVFGMTTAAGITW